MTVQELINALNKVEDKSKMILGSDYFTIDKLEERKHYILLH